MEFKIKSFKELLGMSFNIPSYQRGYRWERENVVALLNDIQEFAKKTGKDIGEFYCLQPVVVKKNTLLSQKEGKDVFDLLDGQQRLTTLWLILSSSIYRTLWDAVDNGHEKEYDLQYESRDNLFSKVSDANSDVYENIDLFFLKKASKAIDEWKGDKLSVINALVPFNCSSDTNDVRIIWYEYDKEEVGNKQSSSIKVFSRLNYGKIPLTDTELIKSLILQCDIYPSDNNSEHSRNIMKEHIFRIATEWDDIEKGLYNDQLWGMLSPDDYKPANHMELLLKFVAEQIQNEKKYPIIDTQHREFFIISEYLGINGTVKPEDYAVNVDRLWMKIRDAYNAIHNWYVNDLFYHLIGLIVLIQGGDNPIPTIMNIFEEYQKREKDDFRNFLEDKIGSLIKISEQTDDTTSGEKRIVNLNELDYNIPAHKKRMIKILEAFNIYLVNKNKSLGYRFDFKEFKKKKVTSLEHIHAQHLNFDETVKYADIKKWFENSKQIISRPEYRGQNLISALDELEKLLVDDKTYSEHVQDCQSKVEIIDDFFDRHANMVTGHMHTLYNMALVDTATNAALSNNLIDKKRAILKQREQRGDTYVPLATKYAFNKEFSSEVADMKFWDEPARLDYFSNIEESYKYFVK